MSYLINARQIPTIQYVTPATGGTITVGSTGTTNLIINPAATLATLTINMPSSPTDGDIVRMTSSQIVTAVTMANGTMIGALTTLGVAGYASFIYSASAVRWFRIG